MINVDDNDNDDANDGDDDTKYINGKDASEDIVKIGQLKIPDHIGVRDYIILMMKHFFKYATMPIL